MSDDAKQPDDNPESGGRGGESEYPLQTASAEARLERQVMRAKLRQRVPLERDHVEAVMKRITADAINAQNTPRERAAAARVVLQAVSINQSDEHKDQPDRVEISMVDSEQLNQYTSRYGINEPGLRGRVEAGSNGSNGSNGHNGNGKH